MNLGKDAENAGCRSNSKVLADVLEAVFGAVYIDCSKTGSNVYKRVILSLLQSEMVNLESMQKCDYKTMLKQLIEKDGAAFLEYKTVSEEGPEHEKVFSIVALVNNNVVGKGIATNKKDAEMMAAKEALALFGVQE